MLPTEQINQGKLCQTSNCSPFSLNYINPLNAKLNSICHLLALLGAHPILHVSRIRVNLSGNEMAYKNSEKLQLSKKKIGYASTTTIQKKLFK
jgi:hypothetical protein